MTPESADAFPRTPPVARRPDIRRLYAALVFVPLFYFLVRELPPVAFFGLILLSALLAVREFYRLYFGPRPSGLTTIGLVSTALLLVSLQWPAILSERTVLLVAVMAAVASRLASPHKLPQSLVDAAVCVLGILYVGLMLGYLVLTRALPEGEFLVFFVVLVTWAGDTGAYYAGIFLGRRRLAPAISPNKTVEGLIGGLLLATGVALLARFWFLPSFTLTDALICGLGLTVAGVAGDLSESMLKRSAGVKDSGGLIPAHGGMLDRLDSMLFTAPAFYYYMTLIKGQ